MQFSFQSCPKLWVVHIIVKPYYKLRSEIKYKNRKTQTFCSLSSSPLDCRHFESSTLTKMESPTCDCQKTKAEKGHFKTLSLQAKNHMSETHYVRSLRLYQSPLDNVQLKVRSLHAGDRLLFSFFLRCVTKALKVCEIGSMTMLVT